MDLDPELSLDFAGDAWDVIVLGIGMAFVAALLWMVYRTMQHPRLPINHSDDKPPNATWGGVLRYLITTPIMMSFWFLVLTMLIGSAARDRTANDVVLTATAVIAGARLLAHIKIEIAHELAKTVPIAILSFIVIGGGFADIAEQERLLDSLNEDLLDTYWYGLMVWDVALTTAWFLVVRLSWRRDDRRETKGKPAKGPFGRTLERFRGIGYETPPSVPAEAPVAAGAPAADSG